MEPKLGLCRSCNRVICICENCMEITNNYCRHCIDTMKLEHQANRDLMQQQTPSKKRPYEPEPMPLSRVKD